MSPIRSRFLISGPRDPARMCDLSNTIGLLISSHLGFRPVGVEKEAYRLIYTNALEVITSGFLHRSSRNTFEPGLRAQWGGNINMARASR